MKTMIRMFALLVAVSGLASAIYAPANTPASPKHAPVTISNSGPLDIPAPLPCQSDGTCVAPAVANR